MKSTALPASASSDREPLCVKNWKAGWLNITNRLEMIISHSVLALINRIAIAAIFFYSGRTKVTGLLTINDSAYALFQNEYKLPLIPPDIAVHLATYAEHFFPLFLVIGLFTRLSALALFGMVLVIEIFVYPDAWPTHMVWGAALLYLLSRGPGRLSLDYLFQPR